MSYLVRNGKSDYAIALSEAPSEAERYAAEEFRRFLEESTGVDLPVITDKEAVGKKNIISIGRTCLLPEDIRLNAKELNYDGFFIKNSGGNLFLAGASERGTLYAVYDFLERFAGVRFLARNDTFVPENNNIELPNLEIKEIPSFEIRSCFAAPIIEDPAFAARKRMFCPYGKNEAKYGYGYLHEWYNNELHSFMDLVSIDKHYERHPEWFSEKDERAWLCLTNGITDDGEIDESMSESVVKEVIARLKERIVARPEVKYFMVGQEDSFSECKCERCTAALERNGNLTGNLLVFINCIAREINKWAQKEFPGREIYIVTFSYQRTLTPPVKFCGGEILPVNQKVIPEKNVFIFYAASSLCYMHEIKDGKCSWNKDINDNLCGWKALTDRFMVWDYGTNFNDFLWYFPNLRHIKQNLIRYKDNGAILAMNQTAPREWRFYDMSMKIYVFSKLLWNLDTDVWKTVKEYNALYFGEKIGKTIDEYLNLMERHYDYLDEKYDGLFHSDLYENFDHTFAADNFPLDLLQNAENLILSAMKEVENDSCLSVQEKEKLIWKLKTVIIQPQNMIVRNYEKYFGEEGKKEYASKFIKNLEDLEFWYYGESYSKTREKLKTDFGV